MLRWWVKGLALSFLFPCRGNKLPQNPGFMMKSHKGEEATQPTQQRTKINIALCTHMEKQSFAQLTTGKTNHGDMKTWGQAGSRTNERRESFTVKKRQKGADGVNMELKHREAETETPDRLYFNEQGSTQEPRCNNPRCFKETRLRNTDTENTVWWVLDWRD